MNRLFPASEWETGEFPLSNMGFDFGNAYQGVPGSMRFS